jgi:tRNA pseudouridine38-40 synthase
MTMVTGIETDTRIVLILEYDGTNYHGSQLQVNAPTIQGEIEKALQKLTGETIRIKAASRTDAGVHAMGQVISFKTRSTLPLKAFVDGLNYYLPHDIAVKEVFQTHGLFDVRRDATSREYKYYIHNSPTRSPITRGFSYQVTVDLDIDSMNEACQTLVGTHDFASFVTSADTARTKRTVRKVYKAEVTQEGDLIILDIIAGSFLPHQVRNIAGSLVRVGQGKMTIEDFHSILEAKTPGLAGPTAPADGLYLVRVNYSNPFMGDVQ